MPSGPGQIIGLSENKISGGPYIADVTNNNRLKTMCVPESSFILEVAKGSVNGVQAMQLLGLNLAVGTVYEDVWCPDGNLVYPTVAETWEVVSTSANDADGGSGARTIEIITLDADYNQQEVRAVVLDGLNPVSISGTHFRHVYTRVKTWGSTGFNEGTIIIRVAGAGLIRTCISYDSVGLIGLNSTQDSHFTVPAGKTFYVTSVFANSTKDHDITARIVYRLFGEDGFLTAGTIGLYQNSFVLPFTVLVKQYLEKTDIKVISKSNNTAVVVTTGVEGLLVNN